ncbi:MAG: hypothetical protein QG551_386 [Patescibacteria group bacterium]|nr:hypothetical protein [Patescibacteria group bacterium]
MITLTTVVLILTIAYIFLLNPLNWYIVSGLITLLSLSLFLVSLSITKNKKWSFCAALYICILLALSYLLGFNLLNTILLTCFIIGIVVLLK